VYAQLEVGIGHEAAKCILLLAENRSSLATFEFKNLATGPEVIPAIPNFSNLPGFEWTNCNAPDSAALTKHEEQNRRAFRYSKVRLSAYPPIRLLRLDEYVSRSFHLRVARYLIQVDAHWCPPFSQYVIPLPCKFHSLS